MSYLFPDIVEFGFLFLSGGIIIKHLSFYKLSIRTILLELERVKYLGKENEFLKRQYSRFFLFSGFTASCVENYFLSCHFQISYH